jgi:hypothetical protein
MADTIEIIQGTATVVEVAGPTGPQGPAGASQGDALTTQGDLLYRGASAAARLGIGTAGQILKVNAGATAPEWGAAPASGVSSVNGETGAVTLDAADVGALQSAVSIEEYTFDDLFTETLPARRNAQWQINFIVSGGTKNLVFPGSAQVGDRLRVALTVPAGTTLNVIRPNPGANVTIATLSGGTRFVYAAQVTQIVGGTPVWLSIGELSAAVGASPLTSSSTGTVGQFSFSDNFMYVCIAPNTWRRVPIAAF